MLWTPGEETWLYDGTKPVAKSELWIEEIAIVKRNDGVKRNHQLL